MTRPRFRAGQKVRHPVFGAGLVVEVKEGARFDVLEVVFPDGTRRLSSNTPQLEAVRSTREPRATPGGDASPARPRALPVAADPQAGSSGTPVNTADAPITGEAVSAGDEDGLSPAGPGAPGSGPATAVGPGAEPAAAATSSVEGIVFDETAGEILDRLEKGVLDPPELFRLRLKAEELVREQGFDRLLSLPSLRDVERFPHQEQACLRVLREMRGRALLADEVGLGKTIEAGIVLREYLLRGLVRRVLILAPASLCLQWQEEMARKFDLAFEIQPPGRPWSTAPLLISSLERAKMPARRSAVTESLYDLVVVDEAHRLRNQRTLNRQLVAELAPRHLLLLTATPVQNDMRELYNLVSLVRPGALGTWRSFKKNYVTRGDPRTPAQPEQLRGLLGGVMVRSTRAGAGLQWSKRHVETRSVRLNPPERELYDAMGAFAVRNLGSGSRGGAEHLSLLVLQKELGSSVQAAVKTLRVLTRHARGEREGRELGALYEMAAKVGPQAKLGALLEILEGSDEKAVVFTQFTATLDFLVSELRARGMRVAAFHGGLSEQAKEGAVSAFRGGDRVLVSTEAGGEGRNLQFCHVLVNYDLPWNPMRVEQRIGRVHRLGQTHDVRVYNLAAEDTIESAVLETLYRKIRLFELVVGEVENILSHIQEPHTLEDRVFRAWNASEGAEARRRRFEQLADELVAAQRRYEQIREMDESILDEA
ncbi:MAG: DEAD/DEAH box helicase family protein [Candidatus Eisenbacteria bacterium]|nr:DEAD/DEAH box helicase family protein [Candidatus Eisenbacteria bacterium]